MDQVRESGVSVRRRRRRRRAAMTLALVTILLLGTFAYATAYFQGWIGSRVPTPVASRACPPATAPVRALKPGAVQLNVFNATNRSGLAAVTAKSLAAQGFKILTIDNDPIHRTIRGVGEVRHGPKGAAAAALAATRLPGATMIADRRTDASVDVVLGNTFKAVSAPQKVTAQAPARGAAPAKGAAMQVARPTPSPSKTC